MAGSQGSARNYWNNIYIQSIRWDFDYDTAKKFGSCLPAAPVEDDVVVERRVTALRQRTKADILFSCTRCLQWEEFFSLTYSF